MNRPNDHLLRTDRTRARVLAALSLVAVFAAGPASAATPLTTIQVASGLTRPVFVTSPPGDERLFIVEQRGADNRGRIKIVKDGTVLARPFLTTGVLAAGNEQGLLGLAFAPDYATSRAFYVNYTDASGTTRIARYFASATDPDSANPTGQIIFTQSQPYPNHNAGWIAFGSDGELWFPLGDGGNGGDPGNRAQNPDSLLGKMLRIHVTSSGTYTIPADNPFVGVAGADEIWALGLRNPFRNSFDRLTGDLVVADVGQETWEEVNIAPASLNRGRGWNYGWRCWEGDASYSPGTTTPCTSCSNTGCFKFPEYVYDHTLGRCSVTGGYVYRGCNIPDLDGTYFFADYCAGVIYSGNLSVGNLANFTDRTAELDPPGSATIGAISSFGEDKDGELYICDLGGRVWQIVPAVPYAEGTLPVRKNLTVLGDSIGTTTPGNVLVPGITPFAGAGNRIRGVGYLKDAIQRRCAVTTATTLSSWLTLGSWDIDLDAVVQTDSAAVVRTYRFTNRATTAQTLEFRDVVAPRLEGDPDVASTYSGAGPVQSALVVMSDADAPTRWLTMRGAASGATFGQDIDLASAVEARIAGDQAFPGATGASPGVLAMALSYAFGSVPPGESRTVTVTTRFTSAAPLDSGAPPLPGPGTPVISIAGSMPFRDVLRLELALPHEGVARVSVFDVTGRAISTIADATFAAGRHPLLWDGKDTHGRSVRPGLYLVRATTDSGESSVRAMRVR